MRPETRGKVPAGFALMVLSCILVGVTLGILIFQAPRRASVYSESGAALPAMTRAVLAISAGLRNWGILWLPPAGAVMAGLLALPLVWRSRWNRMIGLILLAFGLCALAVVVVALAAPTAALDAS